PIIVPVFICDRFAIQPDLPGLRQVKAGNNLGQSRFATAVAANEKNQFARPKTQVDGTKHEIVVFLLAVIRVDDASKLQGFEIELGVVRIQWADFGRMFSQREAKLLDFLQCDIGAAKKRETAHDSCQWSH